MPNERVMTMRWVHTWKVAQDTGETKAKEKITIFPLALKASSRRCCLVPASWGEEAEIERWSSSQTGTVRGGGNIRERHTTPKMRHTSGLWALSSGGGVAPEGACPKADDVPAATAGKTQEKVRTRDAVAGRSVAATTWTQVKLTRLPPTARDARRLNAGSCRNTRKRCSAGLCRDTKPTSPQRR